MSKGVYIKNGKKFVVRSKSGKSDRKTYNTLSFNDLRAVTSAL